MGPIKRQIVAGSKFCPRHPAEQFAFERANIEIMQNPLEASTRFGLRFGAERMRDNDQHFKILFKAVFIDFLAAFAPDLHRQIEVSSVQFMDRELNRIRRLRRVDILVKARFRGQECFFLVLVEIQSQPSPGMGGRLLIYVPRLFEEHGLATIPFVVVTCPAPSLPETGRFVLAVGDFVSTTQNYRNLALKSLDWRKFARSTNPAEIALMSVMKIAPEDRVRAKLQILRLLTTLTLDEKKMDVIAGFVEENLELSPEESREFEAELEKVESENEKEKVMELMSSWKREGIAIGRTQGRTEGRAEGRI